MQTAGIWGKIIGALLGLAVFKLPGLFIGLFIGHQFDKAYARQMGSFAGFGDRMSNADRQAAFLMRASQLWDTWQNLKAE